MAVSQYSLRHLSDDQLLESLAKTSRQAQQLSAMLLAHLIEVDARRLYLREGCGSLFRYCMERLGYTEDETAKRIQSARAARSLPLLLDKLACGELHLSTINLLAPHLEGPFACELVAAASGKSKRQVEELLAAHFPKPDVPSSLRRVAAPGAPGSAKDGSASMTLSLPPLQPGSPPASGVDPSVASKASAATSPAPARASAGAVTCDATSAESLSSSQAGDGKAVNATAAPACTGGSGAGPAPSRTMLAPLSAESFLLKVTLSRQSRDDLLRAQALLSRRKQADLAVVIAQALTLLCDQLESKKFCKRKRERDVPGKTDLSPTASCDSASSSPNTASAPSLAAQSEASAPSDAAQPYAPAHVEPASPAPATGTLARAGVDPHAGSALVSGSGASAGHPRGSQLPRSRYIPRPVRRAVAERDGYRCAYVSPDGHRCTETGARLEFHHRQPHARGGEPTVEDLELACTRHNDMQARLDFGEEHMAAAKHKHRGRSADRDRTS